MRGEFFYNEHFMGYPFEITNCLSLNRFNFKILSQDIFLTCCAQYTVKCSLNFFFAFFKNICNHFRSQWSWKSLRLRFISFKKICVTIATSNLWYFLFITHVTHSIKLWSFINILIHRRKCDRKQPISSFILVWL